MFHAHMGIGTRIVCRGWTSSHEIDAVHEWETSEVENKVSVSRDI